MAHKKNHFSVYIFYSTLIKDIGHNFTKFIFIVIELVVSWRFKILV